MVPPEAYHSMHPAPSLAEAPPKTDESRSPAPPQGLGGCPAGGTAQQRPATPSQSVSLSPPLRKDTPLSNPSPTTSPAAGNSRLSAESSGNNSSYGAETSPTLHQSVFSVTDDSDLSNHRRATRRRTGPLSQQQREKAALIRKLGACSDCRRRRVAVSQASRSPLLFLVDYLLSSSVPAPFTPFPFP
jgi:hypothetical protein